MEDIESSISHFLALLDAAGRQAPTASEPGDTRLAEKIEKLKTQMKELQLIGSQFNDSPDKQVPREIQIPVHDVAWQRNCRLQRAEGGRYTAPLESSAPTVLMKAITA